MADITAALAAIVGAANISAGADVNDDYAHDEALGLDPVAPMAVVRPADTAETARIVEAANTHRVPLTARGSGTGLSGACIPVPGGVVVSFERMNAIREIDTDNHVAVVQPGVTLDQLDRATADHGLVYPVFPGESSASLGGNVNTNAGGMRAVKYGVTRHQVLGLEAVLGDGSVIRSGGRFVKSTAGYDLTQLIVGSEGTLAVVTEAILRLYPRPRYAATILAPFETLPAVTGAVPRIVASGVGPLMVEYIDVVTMAAISSGGDLELGVPKAVQEQTLAYLVVVLENNREDRLGEDTESVADLLAGLGALDVYVLPPAAGTALIQARERAFWTAKAAGADDILDVVVPRAEIPGFMEEVAAVASGSGSWVAGCGHAGDGNVHLSVFQPDPVKRSEVIHRILQAGLDRGGAISGEHGIGVGKRKYLAALEDPAKLALWRRIKAAFDPNSILNPGTIFELESP
ncbi:MAG TPA: FAD-linked oxidase C-terminal domain-containing protein [Acidimicrobiales bacterium]|nr:FAD-linked oxidase C-terminal domain-containing protein [Acidimicrobiales bacterium]